MRLHMACTGYGTYGPFATFAHTPAPYAYRGLSASGFALPWRTAKEFRFECSEVFIRKEGNEIILSEKPASWEDFFNSSERPTDDFMTERVDLKAEKRELFRNS